MTSTPVDPDAAERGRLIAACRERTRALYPDMGHCWTGLHGMTIPQLRSYAADLGRDLARARAVADREQDRER